MNKKNKKYFRNARKIAKRALRSEYHELIRKFTKDKDGGNGVAEMFRHDCTESALAANLLIAAAHFTDPREFEETLKKFNGNKVYEKH